MLSSWREAFCKQNHTVKRQKTPELRTGEAEEVPGEVTPQSADAKLRGRLWEARLGARGTCSQRALRCASQRHPQHGRPGHRAGSGSAGLNQVRARHCGTSRSLCYATVTPQESPVVFLRRTRSAKGLQLVLRGALFGKRRGGRSWATGVTC